MENNKLIKKEETKDLILRPALDLQEYQNYFNTFKQFVSNQLEEGLDKDYGIIPGTGKPTLLKPGAEKLANFFGIYAEPELIDKVVDFKEPFFYFAYRYIAYSKKTGEKLAIGEGSANSKETKFKRNNPYDMENTVRKIAMKRAFVSCIVSATRGSFMFTQDMEDMVVEDNFPNNNNIQNKTDRSKDTTSKITDKQWKFLYAKLHQAGFNLKNEEDKTIIKKLFKQLYNIDTKDTTKQVLNDFVEFLENHTKQDIIEIVTGKPADEKETDNPLGEN